MTASDLVQHEEAWLWLPWLASGRLPQAERSKVERHVRLCTRCEDELALQHFLCNVLTQPDRVTYAPGPSFRKLMERIDSSAPQRLRRRTDPPALPVRHPTPAPTDSWRPPGLAWIASLILVFGLGGIAATVYHSQPDYEQAYVTPLILHIAFDRSVTIGEAEEVLRSTGARVVEGPDGTGIFGVKPVVSASAPHESRQILLLSARLRADPRVRWVEPLATHRLVEDPSIPLPQSP